MGHLIEPKKMFVRFHMFIPSFTSSFHITSFPIFSPKFNQSQIFLFKFVDEFEILNAFHTHRQQIFCCMLPILF